MPSASIQDPLLLQSKFETKTVGPDGGRLDLYGVSLDFPPGALLVEQVIRLGIIWERSRQLELTGNLAMLCPVVSCEPHGLQFQKPVKLTMPHCATADGVATLQEAWNFIPMKSDTQLQEPVNWVEATCPKDYSQHDVTRTHVCIHVNHFTLFSDIGRIIYDSARSAAGIPATKVVKLVAHAPPFRATDFYIITVTCIDDYQEEVGEADSLSCCCW